MSADRDASAGAPTGDEPRHAPGAAPAGTTFEAVWQAAAQRLDAAGLAFGHGSASASDEAAWALIHVLGWPLLESFDAFETLQERPVPEAARARLDALADERIATRKPMAYLLGEAWLHGQRFVVDERVIVPRSFIAELLPEGLDPWLAAEPARIVDCCTGSGCLAILAAQRWPEASVVGLDISDDALAVARRNVALHGLEARVELLRSDLLGALPDQPAVDLLLCNPPYVNAASMAALPPEYRHEPEIALAGGGDGMDLVRRLLREAPRVLSPSGVLVVEIGNEREHFEAAFPDLPVIWLDAADADAVFLVEASRLAAAA